MLYTLVFAIVGLASAGLAQTNTKKLVCYYSSWATYRNSYGKFTSLNIDANLCTHVVYAFNGLNEDFTVRVLDNWLSLEENYGLGDFAKFTSLKRQNQGLKLMIGIGGWNEDASRYSRMASSPRTRAIFITSVIDFIQRYGFDGLNLDWQYPANRGGLPNDKITFISLLQELRTAFNEKGFAFGISASGNAEILNRGYAMDKITGLVDYVSILAYDFHGSWDLRTGMNAPLYSRSSLVGADKTLNQDYAVSLWLKNGAEASKLLLGTPAFGRTFVLANPAQNGVGAPSHRPGNPGPYTQQDGYLGYNEIIEKFKYETGWVVKWDDEQKVPYAHNGVQWLSFDNEESIRIKVEYIKQKGLGGAVVWSLETEDFHGLSGRANPLLNTIRETFAGNTSTIVFTTRDPGKETTQPPIRPTPPGELPCSGEGSFQHPADCTRFYTCIRRTTGFQVVVNNCPQGLAFDKLTRNCNWRDAVPECFK